MSLPARLKHELKAVGMATLFFGAWISALILLKTLVLDEYQIGFSGWSRALVGALILAKVVLVLEHVSLGAWVRSRPAWVDMVLRTALYSLGVAAVTLIEHGLKGRGEHGGVTGALIAAAREAKFPHVLVNTICLSGALLVYNGLSIVRRRLGEGGLSRMFLEPLPEESKAKPASGASD
jgi:hypothetical protein